MNKKGISLIVLVITIIVMIIIAGAIILSLSSSNVTARANLATLLSDRANYQAALATKIAENTQADGSIDYTNINLSALGITKAKTSYGTWSLDTATSTVRFTIDGDVDTVKTYGLTASDIETYTWLNPAA